MTTKATILKNGPIKIEGDFQVTDGADSAYNLPAGKPAFLCRCGLSANKPFCDGAHSKQGFQSEVKAI
jgi:CDGSH-type Zn-finger protein